MSPDDYEVLVADLVRRIADADPELAAAHWEYGRRCRIRGASGYRHQIDVAGRSPQGLVLVECKHWHQAVGVQEVLVLAARKADIEAAEQPRTMWASMVSTRRASKNAIQVAAHFGMSIDTVANAAEYAVRLRNRVCVGQREVAKGSDTATARVIHRSGGTG